MMMIHSHTRLWMLLLVKTVLLCAHTLVVGQSAVRIWEEPLTLPTYKMQPPDKNPMFFDHQSYQGASRVIYPYALQDNLTDEKVMQTYQAVYLENEYLKVCVIPEIGGRLFYATDKTNGYEMFYRQHVIKPANIGMLGAWISGGIEFCVFHHHRASTYLPVDYRLVENTDGSVTLWIGETEPRHRMKWSLGISLYPGRSFLEVEGRLTNPTSMPNSILYWANVATHVNDNYQIIFPPSTEFAVYHAKNSFTRWPITSNSYNGKAYYADGIDASWWKNHPQPISLFAHDLKDGFLAGYDHGQQAGTMHVANPHIVKGAKLWEWGPGPYGSMWDTQVLTDEDGPYAELMTGAYSDNQPDYSWLEPGETKIFHQYWYPLQQTAGAIAANLEATINLTNVDQHRWLLAVNSTRKHSAATIEVSYEGSTLFSDKILLAPGEPYRDTIILNEVKESELTMALTDSKGQLLLEYQPAEAPSNPLPQTVEPPQAPQDIESLEELYFTGLRIRQFHNARLDASVYFREAIRRDSLDTRSNTLLGIIARERFQLDSAAFYFRRALKRPTANYTRPRNAEAFYHLGVVLKALGRSEAAYDTLYRAAWDHDHAAAAYLQLAMLSAARQDWPRALTEVDASLRYQAFNQPALQLKTTLLRKIDSTALAHVLTDQLQTLDPLDHYALFEKYLLDSPQKTDLFALLGNAPESWLELATKYMQSGFLEEAMNLLELAVDHPDKAVSSYPTLHYYMGYLHHLAGDEMPAKAAFKQAASLSPDYCFPYRQESIDVFKTAIAYHPRDGMACYFLGNLYYDRQPDEAITWWEKAIFYKPELAIAHRNLGWAYAQHLHNTKAAITAYEVAISHDPSQARYYYELDKLYEDQGQDIDTRYKILTANHEYVQQRPDALLREIEVMVLHGDRNKAVDYLTQYFFPRQEGVDNLHGIFVDACLSKGLDALRSGNAAQALAAFLQAATYPANHQIATNPDDPRMAQITYYEAEALSALGRTAEANQKYEAVVSMVVDNPEYRYYQYLAGQQIDKGPSGQEVIIALEAKAKDLLEQSREVDFFAKFGAGQSPRKQKAEASYMYALAALIEDDKALATEYLELARQADPNHLWASLLVP